MTEQNSKLRFNNVTLIQPELAARYFRACEQLALPSWLRGMESTLSRIRVSEENIWADHDFVYDGEPPHPKEIPQFNAPSTLGCLMHQVRTVYDDPSISTTYGILFPRELGFTVAVQGIHLPHWYVGKYLGPHLGSGKSEAEALVNALENAAKLKDASNNC